MRLGMDFGTTRTVVAAAHKGNYPLVMFEDEDGARGDFLPSLFAVEDASGQLLAGWSALGAAREGYATLCKTLKRQLGAPTATPERQLRVGEHERALFEWLREYFSRVHARLLRPQALPRKLKRGEALEVVVATPVRATSGYRLMLAEALREAGFVVLGMVHEPAAAAVEYAARWSDTLNSKRERVLIYDLGGGTFDVAQVELTSQTYTVHGYRGVEALGGEDFDEALLTLALERAGVSAAALEPSWRGLLLEHCRQQKEGLSVNSRQILVSLGQELGPQRAQALGVSAQLSVILSTQEYYEACQPLIDQTIEVMKEALPWLPEEGFDLEGIAGVYVVGGASALPAVSRALKAHFGRRLHRSSYPSASTAIGLAMLAHGMQQDEALASVKLQDQLGRHFGVYRELDAGDRISFDPIFTRDSPLPQLGQAPIEIVRRYRPRHNIGKLRFVECTHLDERGEPSGRVALLPDVTFVFDGRLRQRLTSEGDASSPHALRVQRVELPEVVIEERYRVHADGVVDLILCDLTDGYTQQHRLR